jgi:AcrR family transcriptional regulator
MNAMSSEKRPYTLKARAERQEETRRRIVAATAALHEEVGPARTTVAEIARRAGVQRLTVYNHFPQEGELLAACQAHVLADRPPPDFGAALAVEDPAARVAAALEVLYADFRAREPMTAKVVRDRAALPELDALLAETLDVQMAQLADALAAGFGAARGVRPLLAVAVEFGTWQRLAREGLDDRAAARLMAAAVAGTASP